MKAPAPPETRIGIATGLVVVGDLIGVGEAQGRGIVGETPNLAARLQRGRRWMGATHFLTKRLPKVATEMALNVLAYNMKRVMAIIGVAALLEALAA